ncbi:Fur family transcriptional regulator [Allobranchiibius sp. GilTou73]|uniref:Fur family transcriptional regulator n=1 Tax=Allobranchiibius sp. GilTou73 TaxID=2904523 RepID=UPI001F198E94|nr:Fur family transcriptional regulator [Allobranchiibius sp. GilTou73]UIJ36488.1 transcriptional repressor [Allobranchiibius sp. GilTou73]
MRESAAVSGAVERLRESGERVTPARRAVLEVLDESRDHLDAETVAARVDAREPGVHRATVYRSLQSLVTLGVVAHTHVPGGPTIYHLTASTRADGEQGEHGHPGRHGHAHLQCTRCLRFFDMPAAWLDQVREKTLDAMGFEIAPDHAALLGVCASCRQSSEPHEGGTHVH